ncbi:hypothetical protein LPU83_pLPU83b_0095 (plasmid) [Rhizobium favelukesii]|uniref:Uncharacterized protein n=1 Tax=Rhizobium favelukesii TaxID=348824 RepID=W6RH09_9HYPH|nr:hypothetical protein LPU83_pLPU83b_0095 [Rhizobium favelukesii]
MGGKNTANALEVGCLPLDLLNGGADQALAAALEGAGVVLRTLLENGLCSIACRRSPTAARPWTMRPRSAL